ncbi:MAG: dihydroorotate dehydrogenase electron transfer subunit [Clostridiales bacterium]|nr:dihydroorotate dehydrogenase electron transfer subunit [Clostridiales bacterium]
MKQALLTIEENALIAPSVFRMRLSGDAGELRPGQFVNIRIDGLFLRRPISVCDHEDGVLTIIYKVVGKGTEALSRMGRGEKLDVLCGLGNGYDLTVPCSRPMLIGGGVGVPPLYYLAKALTAAGKDVSVVLGFNRAEEIFYEDEFKALGAKVAVTTADGSYGIRGFVTDALPENADYFYACGPEPMLKTLYKRTAVPGEMSFEERMGCGFGACMGCSCKTITGSKRICKEGPVLKKEELLW